MTPNEIRMFEARLQRDISTLAEMAEGRLVDYRHPTFDVLVDQALGVVATDFNRIVAPLLDEASAWERGEVA